MKPIRYTKAPWLERIIASPFHPLAWALFPLIFLASRSIEEMSLVEILPLIPIAFGATVIFYIVSMGITKEIHRAAILASIATLFFFSYGRLIDAFGASLLARADVIIPVIASLMLLSYWIVDQYRGSFTQITKIINVTAFAVLLLPIGTIGRHAFMLAASDDSESVVDKTNDLPERSGQLPDKRPDIYYIILDGYGGFVSLQKYLQFDNSEFARSLRERGFALIQQPRSNYSYTVLSLASALNMDYIEQLVDLTSTRKGESLVRLIRDNKVGQTLHSLGYARITIGTGWRDDRSGYFVASENPYAEYSFHIAQRTEFQKVFYETSALRVVEKRKVDAVNAILFAYDKLTEIPSMEEPTFTFAHIISPHRPYLFDRSGAVVPQETKSFHRADTASDKNDYIEQLLFVNKKILEVVDSILANSKEPPIIILQGDHGTATQGQFYGSKETVTESQMEERMTILNAIYLPDGQAVTYDGMTPVNTFRRILSGYFGVQKNNLEDLSFYSPHIEKIFEYIKYR